MRRRHKRYCEGWNELITPGSSSIDKVSFEVIEKINKFFKRPDLECVRQLLQKGADVNLQTSQGSTSLHLLFKGASGEKQKQRINFES